MLALHIPAGLSLPVQRILVWCALGCLLVRAANGWCLQRPTSMVGSRGPAPKLIQDRTAQEAIRLGARVGLPVDLFGGAA